MSAVQTRMPSKNAVISELALARAQRNTVLIIDDLFSSRLLLAEIVRQIDGKLNLELFDTPSRALEYARNNRVDMVLTDYKLPEFDGVQLVRQIRALPHCIDVPIVVITVVDDRRVRYEALEAGATDFLIKPLDEHETRARCANLLDLRRHKIVLSDQARVLQYQVDKSVAEIHERELETLSKLAKAGEFRDRTTGNHLTRMARYSALIGHNLGLAPETVHVLEVAAPMHDIGKIGIPDSILLKPGPLTPEEDGIMKTHPRIGYDILKGSPSKYLSMGAIIALGSPREIRRLGLPQRATRRRHSDRRPRCCRCRRVRCIGQRATLQARLDDRGWLCLPAGAEGKALRPALRRGFRERGGEGEGDTAAVCGFIDSDGTLKGQRIVESIRLAPGRFRNEEIVAVEFQFKTASRNEQEYQYRLVSRSATARSSLYGPATPALAQEMRPSHFDQSI